MTGKGAAILLLSLSLWHCSFANEHVPVLIWNTNQAQGGVPAVSALQYINFGNFQAKYLASFKPNNILLFLQDALSIEDLTSHTTELHHIKQWMDKGHSLFLPNVEDASHLVHDLPAHGYNVLKLDHDAGLSLKQEDKNLVVVELPSTLTNPSRRRALQKADEVMENVISKIGDQRDFTIIFTGRKPSVDERSDQYEERIRVSRSLKAIDDDLLLGYHQANCTKLYLRQNMTLILYKDGEDPKTVEIPETLSISPDTGDCQSDSASLMMKYANITIDGKTYPKSSITLLFSLMRGSWTLDGADISLDTSVTGNFRLVTDMDSIPKGFSFACTKKFVLTNDTFIRSSGYNRADLVIERFQMQSFQTSDKFDGAWDCVGFFTVPIWCGLLITFLMVIIITMGMFMLSDIKTMDRFDDPKGQSIMVATTD